MPPAKATGRVTKAAQVIDFDAERAKKKGAKGKALPTLKAYGRAWHVKVPNEFLIADLIESESLSSGTELVLSHIVKDERADFKKALLDDEDLTADDIAILMEKIREAAYPGIPTEAS